MVTGTVALFWKFIDLSSLEFYTLSSPEFPGPDFGASRLYFKGSWD